MINGAHVIIYSKDADADRAFLRDVLKLSHVDVGHGWLIFALPSSEVAVHPAEENGQQELYLMCDCGEIQNLGWGMLTKITLPGGGKLGVYQPRHARP